MRPPTFEIYGEFSPGSFEKFPFTVKRASGGTVDFALDVETILKSPSRYEVRNLVFRSRLRGDTIPLAFPLPAASRTTRSTSSTRLPRRRLPPALVASSGGPKSGGAGGAWHDRSHAGRDRRPQRGASRRPLISKDARRGHRGTWLQPRGARGVDRGRRLHLAFSGNPLCRRTRHYDDGHRFRHSGVQDDVSNPVTGEVVRPSRCRHRRPTARESGARVRR